MSGIEIFVRNGEEKAKLIESYLEFDNKYLKALDRLREELIAKGIDIEKGEGRKTFILAVRRLNEDILNGME